VSFVPGAGDGLRAPGFMGVLVALLDMVLLFLPVYGVRLLW
jgi:hypothetical protein